MKKTKAEEVQRFGRMVVIKLVQSHVGKVKRIMAMCRCDCGTEKTVRFDGLTRGDTRSCGCLSKEVRRDMCIKRNKEMGKFKCFSKKCPKTYTTWIGMISRCYNEKQKAYKHYGAVGVVVCDYLKSDPRHLVKIIGIRKKDKPSLDRFPIHNGNYTCGKCKQCKREGWELNIRWATRKMQAENRGDFNVYITAFGKTMLKSQWETLSGIDEETIRKRIFRGWTSEKAVSTPDKFGNCYVHKE